MEHKASSRKGHGKTGRQHLKNHVGFCCHSSSKSGKHFNPKPEVLSESESCSAVSDSLQPHGLYMPLDSPGPNTGVGSLSLLQGIFPTRESNPGLPYCRWILYQLSHKGSEVAQSCPTPSDPMDCSLPGSPIHGIFQARVLEWVAIAFSEPQGKPLLNGRWLFRGPKHRKQG